MAEVRSRFRFLGFTFWVLVLRLLILIHNIRLWPEAVRSAFCLDNETSFLNKSSQCTLVNNHYDVIATRWLTANMSWVDLFWFVVWIKNLLLIFSEEVSSAEGSHWNSGNKYHFTALGYLLSVCLCVRQKNKWLRFTVWCRENGDVLKCILNGNTGEKMYSVSAPFLQCWSKTKKTKKKKVEALVEYDVYKSCWTCVRIWTDERRRSQETWRMKGPMSGCFMMCSESIQTDETLSSWFSELETS